MICFQSLNSQPHIQMPSLFNQLKQYSTLVADTGDIEAIKEFKPQDATTNPSLLLKAAALPQYSHYLGSAKDLSAKKKGDAEQLNLAVDQLAVDIGKEILDIIPGRVSTEIDARLSFDTRSTIARAQRIIDLYSKKGIDSERILVKVASTWEGIRAAEALEKEGIHCNLTLLFGLHQAAACADAGVTLISPFVGRVLDWYKKSTGQTYTAQTDPGVISVKQIYNYYKSNGYETIIMGASFRNIGEICELAGCEFLTISPALMQELADTEGDLELKLDPRHVEPVDAMRLDEKDFRWALNQDQMATEKLSDGIRSFTDDLEKLKRKIAGD